MLDAYRIVRKLKVKSMNNENKNTMDPLSAGIGAIGGVIDSVASIFTKKADRKAQQRENQLAREHTEEMYNKYESPQAQAAQMRAAGLNPQGAVTPNSVGTASTSALPSGGGQTNFSGAIQQGLEFGMAKQQMQKTQEEIVSQQLDNQTKNYDLQMKALEAGNYESFLKLKIEGEELSNNNKRLSNEEKRIATERAKAEFDEYQEARKQGINPTVDKHNVDVATTNNLNQSTEVGKATVDEIRQRINASIAQVNNDAERLVLEKIKSLNDDRLASLERRALALEIYLDETYSSDERKEQLRTLRSMTNNRNVSSQYTMQQLIEMVETKEVRQMLLEADLTQSQIDGLIKQLTKVEMESWDLYFPPWQWTTKDNPISRTMRRLTSYIRGNTHMAFNLNLTPETPSDSGSSTGGYYTTTM